MTVKVRLQNFQPFKDESFEVSGLTVLSGPNNSGKSSVVRAIQGLFENTAPNALVRRGEKSLAVEIDFSESGGPKVKWEKGKTVNQYTIDGTVLQNVGQSCPQEVREAVGVGPIRVGDEDIWPQIAPQFDGQLFLTNRPGSVLAECIADVERVGKLNKALKLAESDRKKAKNTLKVREKDLEDVGTEIESFQGLDEVKVILDRIDARETEVENLRNRIQRIRDLQSEMSSLSESLTALTAASQIDVPETRKADKAVLVYGSLSRIHTEHTKASQTVATATKAISSCRDGFDVKAIESDLGKLTRMSRVSAQYSKVVSEVQGCAEAMESVPDLLSSKKPGKIDKAIGIALNLDRLAPRIKKAAEIVSVCRDALADIPEIPEVYNGEIDSLTSLSQIHSEFEKIKSEFDLLDQGVVRCSDQIVEHDTEIKELLGIMKVCPTCGASHQ